MATKIQPCHQKNKRTNKNPQTTTTKCLPKQLCLSQVIYVCFKIETFSLIATIFKEVSTFSNCVKLLNLI